MIGIEVTQERWMGSVELRQYQEWEGDTLWWWGYSIKRDRNGVEVSRTEPTRGLGIQYNMSTKQSLLSRFMNCFA